MSETATITFVAGEKGRRSFTHNNKNFINYGIKLNDEDIWLDYVQPAKWDAPRAGDVITELEIQDGGQYNDKVRGKLIREATQESANGSTSTKSANGSTSERNDARQISIVRQHSQEMALRWIATRSDAADYTLDDLQALIEHFDRDAWGDTPTHPQKIERSSNTDEIPF